MPIKRKLEKEIQKEVFDFLAWEKITHFKINNVGIFKTKTGQYIPAQTKGIPDAIMHFNGDIHYLEFKRLDGKLSEFQEIFRNKCIEDKVYYHVIRSLNDIRKVLGK